MVRSAMAPAAAAACFSKPDQTKLELSSRTDRGPVVEEQAGSMEIMVFVCEWGLVLRDVRIGKSIHGNGEEKEGCLPSPWLHGLFFLSFVQTAERERERARAAGREKTKTRRQ